MKRIPIISKAIGAMADVLGCAYPANVNDTSSSLIIPRGDFENLASAHKQIAAQYANGQLFDKTAVSVDGLPKWADCEAAVDQMRASALEQFIYDHEPSVPERWRSQLAMVVQEVKSG